MDDPRLGWTPPDHPTSCEDGNGQAQSQTWSMMLMPEAFICLSARFGLTVPWLTSPYSVFSNIFLSAGRKFGNPSTEPRNHEPLHRRRQQSYGVVNPGVNRVVPGSESADLTLNLVRRMDTREQTHACYFSIPGFYRRNCAELKSFLFSLPLLIGGAASTTRSDFFFLGF
ncbi:uncharacterized protein LDX57_000500 [Aspergillus melleus]|uniref:uncharacterized protein n=1 Tax=Aspergillus melleus TaxID=138277 RepID=UPI001E8E4FD4|nr:uncharacterized protein LDX57_000500 [Aspergillus melleus]KAH8422744.1 hypothetical protein LDX57_000500 [Aspergillus melleus]